MAFKMKGPFLYSPSPLKKDGAADGLKANISSVKSKVKKDTAREAYPGSKTNKKTATVKTKKSFSNPDGSVNIPVNPNAPKPVKAPKSNASIKGKTQFEVDTQGVRNVIGKAEYKSAQAGKKARGKANKITRTVKDYFTKR